MLLSREQKELIARILQQEQKKWFSRNKGPLLDKTVADLLQTLRNETVNSPKHYDNTIDWSTRTKKK